MNIYLEIFGYIGTVLVILSMTMTSLIKLRILNMSGSLVSLIYAACVNTWPVAVLNACLLGINLVQTVRELRGKGDVTLLSLGAEDSTAQHLLEIWQKDIEKTFPNCNFEEMKKGEVHILYKGEAAIGFFAGLNGEKKEPADVLYLAPAHRTKAMKERALAMLAK